MGVTLEAHASGCRVSLFTQPFLALYVGRLYLNIHHHRRHGSVCYEFLTLRQYFDKSTVVPRLGLKLLDELIMYLSD